MGFGCTTTNRHVNDVNDYKYHVYRLTNEKLVSDGVVELLDSDDEEEAGHSNQSRSIGGGNDEDSEDECPSADEMDIKPDIHALMRKDQEVQKIKEEVTWNCYEYDRQTNQWDHENDAEPVDNIDLDHFDAESEICVIEPPQKRQRHTLNEFDLFYQVPPAPPQQPNQHEYENVASAHDEVQPDRQDALGDGNSAIASEYQMSDTTLKEKCKVVVRSRGQQLATDMLRAEKSKGVAIPVASTAAGNRGMNTSLLNNSIASMSKAPTNLSSRDIPPTYGNHHEVYDKSVDELENDFITEITKWNYKWLDDGNLNPLQYTMNIRNLALETDFADLQTFQQFVSSFGWFFTI